MPDENHLLELCKSVALDAGQKILQSIDPKLKNYSHSPDHFREVKSVADRVLEEAILKALEQVGLPVLSEESGYLPGRQESEYLFIVDPLDGTFNFIKSLGPCAVSIALWRANKPVFGVVYDLMQKQLVWGGKNFGAYCDDEMIKVSNTANRREASFCTGIPVRFDIDSDSVALEFWGLVRQFSKVRMFGSAVASLVCVARGAADFYAEQNIMLWDVAAGLAIVEGAGGVIQCTPGAYENSLQVYAGNQCLINEN